MFFSKYINIKIKIKIPKIRQIFRRNICINILKSIRTSSGGHARADLLCHPLSYYIIEYNDYSHDSFDGWNPLENALLLVYTHRAGTKRPRCELHITDTNSHENGWSVIYDNFYDTCTSVGYKLQW